MGANMQRQAVPCLRPEKPLVGTGIERTVAVDSGTAVLPCAAARSTMSTPVASWFVSMTGTVAGEVGVDIYNPVEVPTRSNQNTNINQRPMVSRGDVMKGDVVADGASTETGRTRARPEHAASPSCRGTATTSKTRS